MDAEQFIRELKKHQSPAELKKNERFFPPEKRNGDIFMGVRMGEVFALAKKYVDMSLSEVEKLLENPLHEVRAGAVSIMDFQARNKKITDEKKKELFDLYIKRHDRINNWDLVDRAAPNVIGSYLKDKPRDILYKLAKSKYIWERRTAIVSTAYFIKQGETEDTFRIAEILVDDKEDLINKAVGGWIREAGKKVPQDLLDFLNRHASAMPRVCLRYAVENLGKKERDYYLNLKKKQN